jgi:hypothetical protein
VALETASYVANLVTSNPDGGDQRSTADDHLRLIKAVLVRTFPKIDSAVSLSAAQVHYLNDLSASVQLQINQLRDGTATANNAINSRYATSASNAVIAATATLALTANSASFATLAGTAAVATLAITANSASFATFAGTATTAGTATNATNATTAATATTAAFATSAGSAALLSGLAPSDTGTASTIAQRNSSGDIFARYLNQSSGAESNSVGHIVTVTNLDGYHRITPIAVVGQYMEGRNITNKSGTAKNLQAGSGPPTLTGSTNGDMWFYY